MSIASEVEKHEPGQKFESERFFLGLGIGEISALSGVPASEDGRRGSAPGGRSRVGAALSALTREKGGVCVDIIEAGEAETARTESHEP